MEQSILAEKRIKEIEEGTVHYETRIIENAQEIVKEIGRLTANSNESMYMFDGWRNAI